MIAVTCPHCASRFRLRPELTGRGGARVRCAGCERLFDWIPARGSRVVGAVQAEPLPVPARAGAVGGAAPLPGLARAEAVEIEAVRPDPVHPRSVVEELDPTDVGPALVAGLAVEELLGSGAGGLLEAYDEGFLFARFGPALVEAWSRCRERLGPGADPAAFRAALKARLGIDLPGWEASRNG